MDFAAWARLGVLVARPGALVLSTPVFGTPFSPVQVRIGMTVLLALISAPIVATPASVTTTAMALIVGREAAIGFAIGLAMRVLVAAAEGAGQLAGSQVGLSYGAMLDPQSGVRNSTLAILYANLAVVICFLTGAHHDVIRAWLASYDALPIGLGSADPSLGPTVAHSLAFIFAGAIRLAAPIIAVLLVVEVMMGLMSRAAPSLNLLAVAAPLRLPIGLLVVAASIAALPTLMVRLWPSALQLAAAAAGAFK